MGLRYGTKDHYERETEEVERLVRPAPKVKPPRKDRRREETRLDRDPDIDTDQDTKRDPDLSLNYKSIGGSLGSKVLARYLVADLDRSSQQEGKIRVRHRQTGNITYILPETLKEDGGATYEAVESESERPVKDEGVSEVEAPKAQSDAKEQSEDKPERTEEQPKEAPGVHPEDREDLEVWLEGGGPLDNDFKQWAGDQEGVREKNGEVLYRDAERGKFVPFEKLPLVAQLKWKKRFDADSTVRVTLNELREAAKDNKQLQRVLTDLANPKSELSQSIRKDQAVAKKDPLKALSQLRGVELPDSINTVEDLIEVASDLYKASPRLERREVSQEDKDRAKLQIITKFPPDVADKLLEQDLHPEDVTELMSSYHLALEAEPKNIEGALKLIGGSYHIDPASVSYPPRFGQSTTGEELPYEDLTPEDQAVAMQRHRMRTVAISLAMRESIVSRLAKKTDAPEELLGRVVDFTLSRPSEETPQQRMERARHTSHDTFYEVLSSGVAYADTTDNSRWQEHTKDDSDDPPKRPFEEVELSDGQISRLLGFLKGDPAAQQIAVGYLQAGDYIEARRKYLGSDSPEAMSEHQSPKQIWRGIQKAMRYFEDRAKRYPDELRWTNDPSADFRRRVLDKIRTLAPEKYPLLQKWDEDYEDEEYERKVKSWEKTFSGPNPYREQGVAPPPKPAPPLGYELRHGDKKKRKTDRSKLFDEHRRQHGLEDEEARTVQASRVVAKSHRFSSYPQGVTMADADGKLRTAVYWGVDPHEYDGVAPYPKWTQDGKNDLTDGEILKSARAWLRAPVLAEKIAGVRQDTQIRAALDLALQGHAQTRVSPDTYNRLLSRLAATAQSGTLTARASVRVACGCGCNTQNANDSLFIPSGEELPMKASAQIRSFAARVASNDSALAYELLDLASKVAQDEEQSAPAQEQKQAAPVQSGEVPPQFVEHMKKKEEGAEDKDDDQGQQKQASSYSTLRSAVIKMAHANPHLREAYLPLLQTIKQLG